MKTTISNLVKNWKTTASGVTALVTSAVHLGYCVAAHSMTEADCTRTIIGVAVGIGLLCAGDAGATPPKL